jgi:hypothetical protein
MLNLISVSKYKNVTFKSSENSFFLNKVKKELTRVAINHDSLMTGWAHFVVGTAPVFVWDTKVGNPDPQPTPEYKRAFYIEIIDETDGVMEWVGAGYGSCAALEEIYSVSNEGAKENQGKLPVFQYMGSEQRKIGKGSTRVPKFELISWAFPDELPWQNKDKAVSSVSLAFTAQGDLSVPGADIPF